MATSLKNLSDYNPDEIPSGKGLKVGIVCSEWNEAITGALLKGALETLEKHGVNQEDIFLNYVPGTFELAYGAQNQFEKNELDGVITIGCVIQGETPHFDFICDATANGIMNVSLKYSKPCIFGVITTLDLEQAEDRAGGKHGNKGTEAAVTLLKMARI